MKEYDVKLHTMFFFTNNHDERGFHYSYPIIVEEIKCNFQTRNDNHQRGYGN